MIFDLMQALRGGNIIEFISLSVGLVASLLIAIDVHEYAHAWMADELGDPTPRNMGRLSLNPLVHLDPLGTLMLLFAGFGWGKPVPVNPYYLRPGWRKGTAMVSLAGPVANLMTATIFSLPLRLEPLMGGSPLFSSFGQTFGVIIYINVMLALFNLLPIAPLDGFKVALGLLPPRWATSLARYEAYGPMILMLILVLGNYGGRNILGDIMWPAIRFLMRLLVGQ